LLKEIRNMILKRKVELLVVKDKLILIKLLLRLL